MHFCDYLFTNATHTSKAGTLAQHELFAQSEIGERNRPQLDNDDDDKRRTE